MSDSYVVDRLYDSVPLSPIVWHARTCVLGPRYAHYENTHMQHTAIFHARKNDNFHLKIFDSFLILLKTLIVGTR